MSMSFRFLPSVYMDVRVEEGWLASISQTTNQFERPLDRCLTIATDGLACLVVGLVSKGVLLEDLAVNANVTLINSVAVGSPPVVCEGRVLSLHHLR